MKNSKVIGLVGPVRAGKTTAAKYIASKYGYQLASNSDVLREILRNMNMESTRDSLMLLGDSIFSALGNDIIARSRMARLGGRDMVVDGIRYIDEVEYYRMFPGFTLVAIDSSSIVRQERALLKLDPEKKLDQESEYFDRLSSARSEKEVPDIMGGADYYVDNCGSPAEMMTKIDFIVDAMNRG